MTPPFDADFIAFQRALAGQYSLERELGRGGMGIVYLAREVSLDRLVAIKLLPPALATGEDLRDRFVREARTSARLSHPHIVPIHRVSEDGGFTYFAMAWVDGETLTQRVRAGGPLAVPVATRLLREVAWALAYAHARGIVHRDVKPDNILIERDTGRALVTDFGIAQVSALAPISGEPHVAGTAQFMSPEQASGQPVDGRSDLYSLGVVAHFALTGRLPFEATSIPALLAHHVRSPAPALAMRAPGTPRELAQAIDRCLAKDPADRFASGEALADAIGTATESRRETPPPIRVWLAKRRQLDRLAMVFGFYSIPIAASLAMRQSPLLVVVPPLMVALPLTIARISQTRRTLRAGYAYGDLVLGMRHELDRRREELAFEYGGGRPLLLRVSLLLAMLSGSVLATMIFGSRATGTLMGNPIAGLIASATFAGSTAISASLLVRRRISQTLGELRLKLWQSPLARRFVTLAGLGIRGAAPAAIGHRPTELAIGLAADQLFVALPKSVRDQLGNVPAMLRALEEEARAARARVDELASRLAELDQAPAGGSATASRTLGARASTRVELRAARDEAAERLGTAVAALENLRLDLLRLHADGPTAGSITALLERAQRVARNVDLALESRAEVEHSLP
jgi:serine/threonine-protein kinase